MTTRQPLGGVAGLVWLFTGLDLVAAVMSHFLKSPADPQYRQDEDDAPAPAASAATADGTA